MENRIDASSKWIGVAAVLTLTGCVHAPPRSDTTAYESLQKGTIRVERVQAFTDCVTDGFAQSHFITTNASSRQMRRTDGYRVETYNRVGILVSADIFDDGRVELLEGKVAKFINTSGERDAFKKCLAQFGNPR